MISDPNYIFYPATFVATILAIRATANIYQDKQKRHLSAGGFLSQFFTLWPITLGSVDNSFFDAKIKGIVIKVKKIEAHIEHMG